MPVSEKTFRQVAMEDPEGHWELCNGTLRQKPEMSGEHNHLMSDLHGGMWQQLDRDRFAIRVNAGHVHLSVQGYYIPDLMVFPIDLERAQFGTHQLEWYEAPLTLVVEIWSPSTGTYDIETKIQEYQRRGDHEIWRLHPYERTLTTWRRQPDGSYDVATYTSGTVTPVDLRDVTVDLDALFAALP